MVIKLVKQKNVKENQNAEMKKSATSIFYEKCTSSA